MRRTFRKYHRTVALILAVPILLTVITGILVTLIREWGFNLGFTSGVLLRIHTGEIFHLEGIYPILNGLGLLALVITGINMSGVLERRKHKSMGH